VKIFSASQIKEWDTFTITNEPVSSIELMERAAKACTDWILQNFGITHPSKIFCGKGNNGGDGLAIARLLVENKFPVSVYIVESSSAGSDDFQNNLQRLQQLSSEIHFIKTDQPFPVITNGEIIVDALFGTGLNKKPSGIVQELIKYINKARAKTISIDIPSGLYADRSSAKNAIIHASYTLSFQQYKLAFLLAENEPYCGKVIILDIGLSQQYYDNEKSAFELTDKSWIEKIYIPRKPFANKGNYGYACLVAGSYGMMGAAVLSARACLRSGVGKLTCYICNEGYTILQTAIPEAMCMIFGNTFIKDIQNLKNFDVIGIGPGIGKHLSHKQLLQKVFRNSANPVVIDADALNVLSSYPALYKSIPEQSIITPHPKEFERLFGKSGNDFERIDMALQKAKELNIFIVLKGHHTLIATPEGKGYFNSTGNAGMATAGAGDVLTGIITGLLAQKYSSLNACILGVYLHGLAGDIAAGKLSQEAMIASDIIDNLGEGFKQFKSAD
jgi:ADP-dependent NAD(P)H-hydrate dehydratase / NAD(P)H-hydrate epimerase